MDSRLRDFIDRWLWLCPILALAAAAWLLGTIGLSVRSILVVTMLLVCPAIILWGVLTSRRKP